MALPRQAVRSRSVSAQEQNPGTDSTPAGFRAAASRGVTKTKSAPARIAPGRASRKEKIPVSRH